MNKKRLEFIRNLEYISGYEIKDCISGDTSADILLTPEDLEQFEFLGLNNAEKFIKEEP